MLNFLIKLFKFSLLFLFINPLSSLKDEKLDIVVERDINWSERVFTFDLITHTFSKTDDSILSVDMLNVISSVNEKKNNLIREAMFDFIIDSTHTFYDYYNLDKKLLFYFSNLDFKIKRKYIQPSYDFKSLTIRYELPIFPEFISLFISHNEVYEDIYLIDDFIYDDEYTGILVYVSKNTATYLKEVPFHQAFFINIYDDDLNLYWNKNMVDSNYLKKWGMLEYTKDLYSYNEERVGERPLKLVANSLYGKYSTDIVLDKKSINKIFNSKKNINLLRKGKLILILDF